MLLENLIDAPDWVDNMALAATTEAKYTVPKGFRWALITGDVLFYYNTNGGTAAIPSGNVTDGTGSMPWALGNGPLPLNIATLSKNGGKISFIASATCKVGISLYS